VPGPRSRPDQSVNRLHLQQYISHGQSAASPQRWRKIRKDCRTRTAWMWNSGRIQGKARATNVPSNSTKWSNQVRSERHARGVFLVGPTLTSPRSPWAAEYRATARLQANRERRPGLPSRGSAEHRLRVRRLHPLVNPSPVARDTAGTPRHRLLSGCHPEPFAPQDKLRKRFFASLRTTRVKQGLSMTNGIMTCAAVC
jgi:hypothetical protein